MSAKRLTCVLAFLAASGATSVMAAEELDIEIEVPVLILDVGEGAGEQGDDELDLANIVQSAAKGVTTVQEAPAIVTVITADDISERGFIRVDDILDTVPGWLRFDGLHSMFSLGLTRGTPQGMLYMHNGMSMFDTFSNTPLTGHSMPIEVIKRIEVVTGPGGVLWGANSFLGIVNVITKDADDVDGVEARVYAGDGDGDREVLGGYVMAGIPELLSDKVSAFFHASFRNFHGQKIVLPQHLFSTPLPFPNSTDLFGPLTASDQKRSTLFNLDGKLSIGNLNIGFWFPFFENHMPSAFAGPVSQSRLPEQDWDADGDGRPDCPFVEPWLPNGQPNPAAFATNPNNCTDSGHLGGESRGDWTDRYITADWRTRFADGKAGAAIRAYGIRSQRGFEQANILTPTFLLEGGLSFTFIVPTNRVGGTFDGDWDLPHNVRLLYGAEGFHDWLSSTVEESRQGAGSQANLIAPYDYARTPLACPRQPNPDMPGTDQFVPGCPLTALFSTNRTVLGAYLNPQWRPSKRLILDGGVRLQIAPDALSQAPYPLVPIFSAAAVYRLAKDWHTKLNFSQGFRPPVFNNTDANSRSPQLDGDPDLNVERSQSIQAELNARVFKGDRRLREVNFRADYSYTTLQDLIQVVGGRYENTADRGIHSVEFLGKVYIKGGHRVELGYTWLKTATEDIGSFKVMPEHWFNLTGVFNLIEDKLQATTMLKVVGAKEDPNRLIEHRDLDRTPEPGIVPDANSVASQPYQLVLDRLPPSAELAAGLTWYDALGIERLQGRIFAYNAFNARHYEVDAFSSYEPRLEFMPNPHPDFRFISSLSYAY